MNTPVVTRLIASMLAGEAESLAELISLVENDSRYLPEIMGVLQPRPRAASCVGITGPSGTGKSTLVDKLTRTMRDKGLTVGIIAVDPTSPVSGGAVLGDRIRMRQHYLDEGVFIRSMASRGGSGGLSKAVAPVVKLMDAFGKDRIIVETVGVGQSEIGIRGVVRVVVLVLTPGYGDSVQLMKAGLTEVADIIVVNKADLEGAEKLAGELKDILIPNRRGFDQTVVITQATNGAGVEELYREIDRRLEKPIK